jgi:hypothetical protein
MFTALLLRCMRYSASLPPGLSTGRRHPATGSMASASHLCSRGESGLPDAPDRPGGYGRGRTFPVPAGHAERHATAGQARRAVDHIRYD